MLQSPGYSKADWPRVRAGQAQSEGIRVLLPSQWEEEDVSVSSLSLGEGDAVAGQLALTW